MCVIGNCYHSKTEIDILLLFQYFNSFLEELLQHYQVWRVRQTKQIKMTLLKSNLKTHRRNPNNRVEVVYAERSQNVRPSYSVVTFSRSSLIYFSSFDENKLFKFVQCIDLCTLVLLSKHETGHQSSAGF